MKNKFACFTKTIKNTSFFSVKKSAQMATKILWSWLNNFITNFVIIIQPEMLGINFLLRTSSYPQHLVLSTPQHALGLEHQPNIQISKAGAKRV